MDRLIGRNTIQMVAQSVLMDKVFANDYFPYQRNTGNPMQFIVQQCLVQSPVDSRPRP